MSARRTARRPGANALDRTKPPAAGPAPKVSFPPFHRRDLSCGMPLLVVENHALPIVTAQIVVRAGAVLDGSLPGLADFTATLATKGTPSRSAIEITEEIDFYGASLAPYSGWDASYIAVSALTKHLPAALAVAADCLLHPVFPAAEIARQQALQIADLAQAKADGGYLASRFMAQSVFGSHPYGAMPSEQSIRAITAGACAEFHAAHYVPNNAFAVVAGDVETESVAKLLDALFAGWQPRSVSAAELPAIEPIERTRALVVAKPGAVQSSIRIAQEGVRRDSGDFLALDALNMLFGGYFNSRLNANLRERHGYTYGVRSRFDARSAGGIFFAACDVRTEVTGAAVAEILGELQRIVAEPVPDDELEMMKNFVAGQFPLTIETPQHIANMLQNVTLYGLPEDYFATVGEKVRALSSAELREAAARHLHPGRMTITVAGDAAQLPAQLKHFAPVHVVDCDGNALH